MSGFRSTRIRDYQRMRTMASNVSLNLAPTTDSFDVDSISSYTVRNGTWSISSGIMSHTSGSAAAITRNGVSWADGTVSSGVVQGGNNGLLARFQDNNNYYVAIVRDASSASGTPNTAEIYKRVSGSFTSLGSTSIAFTRNTLHTVEFTLSGSSLVLKFDGITQLSITNTQFASAGGVGMWGDTLPNQWESFSWTT